MRSKKDLSRDRRVSIRRERRSWVHGLLLGVGGGWWERGVFMAGC